MKQDDNRCLRCGIHLIGKNAIDVGYCIPCFNAEMADDEDEQDDEPDINYDFHEGRGENNELL
jgi:hypothetical protein